MNRNKSNGKTEQSNKENITQVTCPNCKHDRAWTSRGLLKPNYSLKCTKCGRIIR